MSSLGLPALVARLTLEQKVRLPAGYHSVRIAPKRNWLQGEYGPARGFRVR